jgi:hypothetical protein
MTNECILGQGGEQVSEVDGSGSWLHTNAYAGGQLVATLDPIDGHNYADPVAQQQMTTSAAGVAFIKGWEGWNGTVDKKTGLTYTKDDGFGNGTIGWGHKCGACTDFAGGITKAQGTRFSLKI